MFSVSKKGFTLVELMVVIAIISMLVAFLYPSLSIYLARGRDTQKVLGLQKIKKDFTIMALDQNYEYPGGWFNNGASGIGTIADIYMSYKMTPPIGATKNLYKYVAFCSDVVVQQLLPNKCSSFIVSVNLEIKNLALNTDYPGGVPITGGWASCNNSSCSNYQYIRYDTPPPIDIEICDGSTDSCQYDLASD